MWYLQRTQVLAYHIIYLESRMHAKCNAYSWGWKKKLTTSRKKSTCGRLCTKNRTGCRSIVTLTVKSCGVPGLTVFRGIASWCEWINVSSKSNTSVLRCTILSRCRDTGDNGNTLYLTGWYWTNCNGKIEKRHTNEKNKQYINTTCQKENIWMFFLWCKFNLKISFFSS